MILYYTRSFADYNSAVLTIRIDWENKCRKTILYEEPVSPGHLQWPTLQITPSLLRRFISSIELPTPEGWFALQKSSNGQNAYLPFQHNHNIPRDEKFPSFVQLVRPQVESCVYPN